MAKARPDDPWNVFRTELLQHMALRGVSAPEMARLLHYEVSDDTVNNWRGGKSRPRLDLLPIISEVLKMGGEPNGPQDPTYLLRRMGLLPNLNAQDAYSLAYRIEKLDLRFREAIERNAQGGRDHGLSSILRACAASGTWAVAIWPGIEGPPDCVLHVADRLDFRRLDRKKTSPEEVFGDPTLHQALREAYAVPSTRQPRWTADLDGSVSTWSISHVGSPASPLRRTPHPGASTVLCYAITVDSWVNDTASLLSLALGYGLTTTRDLAMEVTGISLGKTSPESRSQAHATLLRTPPRRRVWSHHAAPDSYSPDPLALAPEAGQVVWLREGNALLSASSAKGGLPLRDLLRSRDLVDELASHHAVQVLEIDAVGGIQDRWQQVLEGVAAIYTNMTQNGLLGSDATATWEVAGQSDPFVARPFLNWLKGRIQ